VNAAIVAGLLTFGALGIIELFRQARLNRQAGLTPDGAPLPRFGQFVRALIDAPLSHGSTFVALNYDPTTAEGMVVKLNGDMTMQVMEEHGESFRCLIVGYVLIDTPAWYTGEDVREEEPGGTVINNSPNIVWPQSDKIH